MKILMTLVFCMTLGVISGCAHTTRSEQYVTPTYDQYGNYQGNRVTTYESNSVKPDVD